ncbi:PQQ-dependent sugar dehydrogenase [Bacillus sp. KH172YL63]|uniref:PQQ-dependent sugar dehydrogenase n=1 Tax=Bacillus sp. KH172YL63 TaxID=2709784 RepID=UPI0013E4E974|nr:PQQ-dependent sugar dehydrogenase [Bacillus sp. KH172YL63]BCB06008.1 dehydrogenase [Bacillus sp. KH172YL63]
MRNRKSIIGIIVIGLLLLSGCQSGQQNVQQEESESAIKPSVEATVIADNLSIPWEIQKWDDVFYLTQRTGGIVEVKDGKKSFVTTKFSQPLSKRPEAGLLGFVLDPDFGGAGEAFAYYTYEDDGDSYNRVVKLRRSGNQWIEEDVLLDRIPSGQYHHGGRLGIGPDHKLYITTGDATEKENAQDISYLGGKILRMNLDGSIPEDNPFKGSYVYSYGHRNPQGLVWTEDGNLYETEHGPNGYDEINLIEAGSNYGWPEVTGDERSKSMTSPLAHSGEPSWAPSGIDRWHQDLLFASLAGQSVKVFDSETRKVTELLTGFGRVRDVRVEGDFLYFITNNTDGRGIPREKDDTLYKVDLTSFSLEE